MRNSKRGAYFFLIDVFLVVLIFFITVLTILSFRSSSPSLLGVDQQLSTYSQEFFGFEVRDYSSPVMDNLKDPPAGPIFVENWNKESSIDELIVLLEVHGYGADAQALVVEAIDELPPKYGFSYTIDDGSGPIVIHNRDSLVSLQNSQVKLSRQKVTWPRNNLTTSYDPYITEVSIWQ